MNTGTSGSAAQARPDRLRLARLVPVWAWVILPLLYGLSQLVIKIPALFGG